MEFGCRCRCGDFQLQHSLVSTTKRGLWFGWLRFGPAEGLSESGGMLDAQLPPSLHKDCASDSSSAMNPLEEDGGGGTDGNQRHKRNCLNPKPLI